MRSFVSTLVAGVVLAPSPLVYAREKKNLRERIKEAEAARDPFVEPFPRLFEDFMSVFESLGGRRYMEAVQRGDDINVEQDYQALQNFFGQCLRDIVTTDAVFLRPNIIAGYQDITACVDNLCPPPTPQINYVPNVNTAAGTDFRFGDDGPGNYQGTWWIRDADQSAIQTGAILMNFAESLDPIPLSPGMVLPPDPDGINFKIRVGGDRTFGFASAAFNSAFRQAINQDLIYEYQIISGLNPFNPAGTIFNPEQMNMWPSFNVPGMPCVRIRFRQCTAFAAGLNLYGATFTISDNSVNRRKSQFCTGTDPLVTDPTTIAARMALCAAGTPVVPCTAATDDPATCYFCIGETDGLCPYPDSRIWVLVVRQAGGVLNTYQYIQIVDGSGTILSANMRFIEQRRGIPPFPANPPNPGLVYFRGIQPNTPLVPCGIAPIF